MDGLVTVGASLNHVHVPGRPAESHQLLGPDELELGMGIHNEAGCKILKPRPSLDGLLDIMTSQLVDKSDADRAYGIKALQLENKYIYFRKSPFVFATCSS